MEQDCVLGRNLRNIVNDVLEQYELYLAQHTEGNRPSISIQHVVAAAKQASEVQRLTLAMPTQILEMREKKQIVMYLPEVEEIESGTDIISE